MLSYFYCPYLTLGGGYMSFSTLSYRHHLCGHLFHIHITLHTTHPNLRSLHHLTSIFLLNVLLITWFSSRLMTCSYLINQFLLLCTTRCYFQTFSYLLIQNLILFWSPTTTSTLPSLLYTFFFYSSLLLPITRVHRTCCIYSNLISYFGHLINNFFVP